MAKHRDEFAEKSKPAKETSKPNWPLYGFYECYREIVKAARNNLHNEAMGQAVQKAIISFYDLQVSLAPSTGALTPAGMKHICFIGLKDNNDMKRTMEHLSVAVYEGQKCVSKDVASQFAGYIKLAKSDNAKPKEPVPA